ALLPTIPDYKSMSYYFGEKGDCQIYTGLNNKLSELLSDIKFVLVEKRSDPKSNYSEFLVQASYNDVPVDGILVSYFDGHAETPSAKWTNGTGSIRQSNDIAKTSSKLELFIDYEYKNHAFDSDVKSALQEMSYKKLPESAKTLDLRTKLAASKNKMNVTIADKGVCNNDLAVRIERSVQALCEFIEAQNYGAARKYFTASGYRDFNKLIDYGRGELLSNNVQLYFVPIHDLYCVRSLPMQFNFRNDEESFTEKVNMLFDQEGIIEKLTFAVSDETLKDILSQKNFSDEEKAEITNFMELYKTAYCLKDDSFVENVFTEDALIIVGNVIEKDPDYNVEGLMEQLGTEKVKYVRLSKDEYLKRLQEQFEYKEFINI
ncbi:MAG TPA: hypothetical protein PLD62_11750, partial [Candidatus Cloacimonadota bacterium]|nr:hypothetical protein [Candidatus Cloacimonadota bacterium]